MPVEEFTIQVYVLVYDNFKTLPPYGNEALSIIYTLNLFEN